MYAISKIWWRLSTSKAARNSGASYFAFFSVSASAFVSVPILVQFLSKEEIGLWMIVSQAVSYLLWMDLGVGSAAARKFAEPIVANDQPEINRWWTAIFIILAILGTLLIVVGLVLTPLLTKLFQIPQVSMNDAVYLFAGSFIVAGISFPMKAVPGFLTAQERFHWCPIGQAIMPWISLGVFYLFLKHGIGIRSYVWSLGAVQICSWAYFIGLVVVGPQKPCFDITGLSIQRLRELFSFSLHYCLLSFSHSLLQSLPALVMARSGGLAIIPLFSFTTRSPAMIANLITRTAHAFYPQFQTLYVSNHRDILVVKFNRVTQLTLALALAGAGCAILGNRVLVGFLAGPDFFAGPTSNAWMILTICVLPFFACFENLLPLSGSMGKTGLVSIVRLGICLVSSFWAYRQFGMPGLAAVISLSPAIYGVYAMLRGSENCGFPLSKIATRVSIEALLVLILIIVGCFIVGYQGSEASNPEASIPHQFIPTLIEGIVGGTLLALGGAASLYHVKVLMYIGRSAST